MHNSERKFGRITVSIQMINQMVHLNASLKAAETQSWQRMIISTCETQETSCLMSIFFLNQEINNTMKCIKWYPSKDFIEFIHGIKTICLQDG